MEKIKTQAEKVSGRFGAALAMMAILLANLSLQAQYESFFGRESWEYHINYLMTCYTDEYDPNVFNTCCATFPFDFHHDDTVKIGGNTYYYYQYPDYYFYPSVFLREDTVAGRLYARYGTDETDDEYLLCDLSLSVGDTFILPDGTAHWNWFDYKMIVDSVSYTYGKKVIYLSLINCGFEFFYYPASAQYLSAYNISLRFMEGIGPIYGICPTSAVSLEQVFGLLLCMHKDDTLCYMTHETLGCYQSGCDVPQYPQSYLQAYPNPFNGQFTLEFVTEEEVSGTVMVRDIVGRVCRQFPVNDKKTVLDMSALPQGVYSLTFTDRQNRKITKKIVKQ